MTSPDPPAATVLVVAPTGKDAPLAAEVLRGAGITAEVCPSLDALCGQLGDGTGAVLLAEEALIGSAVPQLTSRLAEQPAWSDIPLIVLTTGGRAEGSFPVIDVLGPSGNVTLLERPLRTVTLVSTVQVALRARRRQFEVRDLLRQRETILRSISDAFVAVSSDWRYTFVNDRAAEAAGMTKEEMIGRTVWDVYPHLIGSEFFRVAQSALATRQPARFEYFYQSNGRWMDTHIYPARDGLVILRSDITERKNAEALVREGEAKLQESENRLRLAMEAAHLGTWDFRPLQGELRWDERCKELFGLPPDAPVDYATFLAGVHPEDRERADQAVQSALSPGAEPLEVEYRTIGLQDKKERWVAARGLTVFNAAGQADRFIGTIIDITRRKGAEIELQRAKQEAEAADQAKDRFLAMLSHELRTPLTPVLISVTNLERDPDLSDDLRAELQMIHRNIDLEARIIDDLLDLTRIAHGKLALHNDAVDIHVLLDHALEISLADLDDKQLAINRHFDAAEHFSWADPARLQQVFWNVIKNAIKFTPTGGRIDVRTRNHAGNIVIAIADNGNGIAPELLPRIFDAFEQGGRKITANYGGLGLGLAVSKRVVEAHGGTIAAASDGPGRGATFTVELAAMATSLLDSAPYVPNPNAPYRSHILLVEDHLDTARVLRRIMQHAGHRVEHAASLANARKLAAAESFDLLVSDVGLPDGSGLDLMRELRQRQELAGIALSGFGMEDDIAASKAAGFAEHLTKPVDWDRLRAAIERLQTQRQPA